MSTFRTALGEEYSIERRLPNVGWRPRFKGSTDIATPGDLSLFGDDSGILAGIAVALAAVFAAIFVVFVLIPLLVFVAEVALVVAVVIPLTVVALVVGFKQHTVVLVGPSGRAVEQRAARGLIDSRRAARALRASAEAGYYNSKPVGPPR